MIFHENGNEKKTGLTILIAGKIESKTKAITRDKEGSSNFTSGYLSEETQNTTSKGHVNPCVYCSIIYNNQDIEATWVFTNR